MVPAWNTTELGDSRHHLWLLNCWAAILQSRIKECEECGPALLRCYSLAGTSPSCCTGDKNRWMPSTIWTYVLKHSLMAPFPNGCEKTEESDQSDTLRNMFSKNMGRSLLDRLYLGGHLEVDLVLSPLPCDGIVPAANKSKDNEQLYWLHHVFDVDLWHSVACLCLGCGQLYDCSQWGFIWA